MVLNQMIDVLVVNFDLKGIFGVNELMVVGMGCVLQQLGKSGKVVVIGFDGNQDLQGFVCDGMICVIVV